MNCLSGVINKVLITGVLMMATSLVSEVKSQQEVSGLSDTRQISAVSILNDSVNVGEPFEYIIRVDYRPDRVRPDFRRLLRDVALLPFEQIHRTRTLISQSEISDGIQRYQISYSIVAVNVVPGQSYTIDPLVVHYEQLESGEDLQIKIESKEISIGQFHSEDFLSVPFQTLKGEVYDNSNLKRLAIIFGVMIFLAGGISLIRKAVLKPLVKGQSFSDISREKFETVRVGNLGKRQKIIQYEHLILSMLKHYLSLGARLFWIGSEPGSSEESNRRGQLKQYLQSGYRPREPEDKDLEVIEGGLISLYAGIEQKASSERLEDRLERQGTVRQRINRNRLVFYSGVILLFLTFILLTVLLNPRIWVDEDARVFNNWMNSLPDRLLAEDNQDDLDILDVQVLGNISEQQRVLEKLQSDRLRSAYLYNYGTLVAKVFRKILTNPPEDEEDEAAEPPSFEFPLLLLSNAVRFYPYDEDTRRNLEIVILLRENEEEKGSDDIQGELGPSTPATSRDMNQVLF